MPIIRIREILIVCLSATVSLCGAILCAAEEKAKRPPVDFSSQVRPILSDKCFKCHGPDEESRQAELRLDRREDAAEVLAPDGSLLARITAADADELMPPADSKLKLSNREIDLLRRWIEQGADYQRHWSFAPIESPPLPQVKQAERTKNEIDAFILARLRRESLKPAPVAGKEKLIRRVSFDLTGLPPTIAEIDAFLADSAADAYEKLVDRLLKKTEYGERMAVDWLDVARYSDTYGYQVDRDRHVWPWRDWVIQAFNENMPYDQFVTWQLAGDLLPGATDEQILATTFNRLHPQKVEGGSTPEEFRVEYVADRNHTFATAFLGLTLECSRCHDHKYDPITQKEYYQLFAFFNSIDESGLYSYHTPAVPTPTLLLPNEESRAKSAALAQQIATAETALRELAERRRGSFQAWLPTRPTEVNMAGEIAHLDFEKHQQGANVGVASPRGKGVKLSGDDPITLEFGNFQQFEPFSVSLWLNTPDVKKRAVVFHRTGGWTDAGSRGYQLLIEEGKLSASLIHFWPGNAIRVRTGAAIPTEQWLHVAVSYDGSSRADGLRIFIDGKQADCQVVRDHLYKNITGGGGDNLAIGARSRDRGFTQGLIDEFRVFNRRLTALEIAQLHDGDSLVAALKQPLANLTAEQKAALFDYYLSHVDPEYQAELKTLRGLREERSKTVDAITEIMVMRELPAPRPTFLLKRGAYDAPTDPVSADTPAAFPPLSGTQPHNRLGLARWLTDPAHPLMARVTVNRLWRICFGAGLVRTPEDFGSQGEPPTHPQLLDWLARDFMDHGWDVKRLMKQMVTSATYRQSSLATPEQLARDPQNLLLARAPRYRLTAEMIRDNALAAGGLLVQRVGGAPVRPYEVAASFKPLKRDAGAGLYRRSLYTFWKRTAPAPVMMSLDASKRDVCSVKRERTSSPLQALVLMNDPQFVEAARLLAQTMLKKHPDDTEAMIEEMFRTLTSRRPSTGERGILKTLYEEQRAHFEQRGDEAAKYLKTGDAPLDESIPLPRLAAAGVLAVALMNFDECVTKR